MAFPPDRVWGNVGSDGTVTGLIGDVYRREADIGIDAITISCKNIARSREAGL